jgi:hypothetical protein
MEIAGVVTIGLFLMLTFVVVASFLSAEDWGHIANATRDNPD